MRGWAMRGWAMGGAVAWRRVPAGIFLLSERESASISTADATGRYALGWLLRGWLD